MFPFIAEKGNYCSAYSVWRDVSGLHLGQEVRGRELEVILQVNLQQGVVVTDIVLRA